MKATVATFVLPVGQLWPLAAWVSLPILSKKKPRQSGAFLKAIFQDRLQAKKLTS
jgi:hypothetical protein